MFLRTILSVVVVSSLFNACGQPGKLNDESQITKNEEDEKKHILETIKLHSMMFLMGDDDDHLYYQTEKNWKEIQVSSPRSILVPILTDLLTHPTYHTIAFYALEKMQSTEVAQKSYRQLAEFVIHSTWSENAAKYLATAIEKNLLMENHINELVKIFENVVAHPSIAHKKESQKHAKSALAKIKSAVGRRNQATNLRGIDLEHLYSMQRRLQSEIEQMGAQSQVSEVRIGENELMVILNKGTFELPGVRSQFQLGKFARPIPVRVMIR